MALVDCYAELFTFTGYLLRDLDEKPVPYEFAEKNYASLIQRSEERARSSGYSEEVWMAGFFPCCAWIDESILCSDWPEKAKWEHAQLQRRYFHTTNAGQEVFERLANLGEEAQEVREVYAYCLALGLRGVYYQVSGGELREISSDNLGSLSEAREFPQELFPDAYESTLAGRKTRRRRWRSPSLFSIFVFLLPIALFCALFFSYDLMLSNEIAGYLGLDVAPLYRGPFFADKIGGPQPAAPAHSDQQKPHGPIVRAEEKIVEEVKEWRHHGTAHYQAAPGDTLASVAARQEIYGDPLMWPILYRHNLKELVALREGADLPTAPFPHGLKLMIATPHEIQANKKSRAEAPWVINVLSTAIDERAIHAAIRLVKEGEVVYLTKTKVEGKEWTRVRVGFYSTNADAKKESERIVHALSLDKIWVAKIGPQEFERYAGF